MATIASPPVREQALALSRARNDRWLERDRQRGYFTRFLRLTAIFSLLCCIVAFALQPRLPIAPNLDVQVRELLPVPAAAPSEQYVLPPPASAVETHADRCAEWGCECADFASHFATRFGWRVAKQQQVQQEPQHRAPWWLGALCRPDSTGMDGPTLGAFVCSAWQCACAEFAELFGVRSAEHLGWAESSPVLTHWWKWNECTATAPAPRKWEWAAPLSAAEIAVLAPPGVPRGGCAATEGTAVKYLVWKDPDGTFSDVDACGESFCDMGFSNTLVAFSNALACLAADARTESAKAGGSRGERYGLAIGPVSHENLGRLGVFASELASLFCIVDEATAHATPVAIGASDLEHSGYPFFNPGCGASLDRNAQIRPGAHVGAMLKASLLSPTKAIRDAVERFTREHLTEADGSASQYIGVHWRSFHPLTACVAYTSNELIKLTKRSGAFDGLNPASVLELCTMPPDFVLQMARESGGFEDGGVSTAKRFLATDARAERSAKQLEAAGFVQYDEMEFAARSLEGLVVDMLLLARATYFVGNPASSMAANVVTLRRTLGWVGPTRQNFMMPMRGVFGGTHVMRSVFSGRRRLEESETGEESAEKSKVESEATGGGASPSPAGALPSIEELRWARAWWKEAQCERGADDTNHADSVELFPTLDRVRWSHNISAPPLDSTRGDSRTFQCWLARGIGGIQY